MKVRVDLKSFNKIFLLILSVMVSGTLFAAELYEVNTSVRALGMGNAYTSIVSDKDALFYNPAGLGRIEGYNFTIFDPRGGVDGQDVYNAATQLANSSSYFDTLRTFFGKKLWIGGGAKSGFTMKGFGFAIYDTADISANLSNPAYPNFNVNFINDYGAAVGLAFDLAPGFTMGLTGKRITRLGARLPIGVDTLATASSSDLQNQINNRGTGYSLDGGLSFTIASPVKPTFSYVWKDMGLTTFTKDSGSIAPPQIKDEQIFGFGLSISSMLVDIKPSIDFKYMNRPEEQLGKKIHAGIEIGFPFLDLRAGINQGYYTLGVGIDMSFIKFDVATYGVELGEYPGQDEDRRYVAQLTVELGFDPNFNFLKGGNGSGRGSRSVKQRR